MPTTLPEGGEMKREVAALELVRAAKAMSAYWPSILPSKGVIPNNLIVDLRAALSKAEGAQ